MKTKKNLFQLHAFINDVRDIPDKITDLSEEDLQVVYGKVDELIMKVRAFIKVNLKDEKYLEALLKLKFRSKDYDGTVYNSRHYMNDEFWKKGKTSFITMLLNLSFELKEKMAMEDTFFTPKENIRFVAFFILTIVGLLAIYTTSIADGLFADNKIAWGKLSLTIILLLLTSILLLRKHWLVLLGMALASVFGMYTLLR